MKYAEQLQAVSATFGWLQRASGRWNLQLLQEGPVPAGTHAMTKKVEYGRRHYSRAPLLVVLCTDERIATYADSYVFSDTRLKSRVLRVLSISL